MEQDKKHSKAYTGSHAKKRAKGVYYTTNENPFTLKPFMVWARRINLKNLETLEPFAGENHIIRMLRDAGFCKSFKSYDISPKDPDLSLIHI